MMLQRDLDTERSPALTYLAFYEDDSDEPIAAIFDREIVVPSVNSTVTLSEMAFENSDIEETEEYGSYQVESLEYDYTLANIEHNEEGAYSDESEGPETVSKLLTMVKIDVTAVDEE